MKKLTLFSFFRTSRFGRYLAFFTALNFIAEIVSPTVALALTSGPAAPEFSSFEPVATTNMVNDFSGDFTYNLPVLSVPGPDGGGYSMSLSYHSGVSSEEEASWVGFGWTLNPGAINRGKKGYPDEYNGATVYNYNKARPNWTQESQYDFNMEPNSADQEPKAKNEPQGKPKKFKLQLSGMQQPPANVPAGDAEDMDLAPSISLQHTVRYNNYSGFEIGNSVGVSAKDKANDNSTVASANWSKRGSVSKLGFYISPSAILRGMNYGKKMDNLTKQQKNWKKRLEKASKAEQKIQKARKYVNIAQQLGVLTYNSPSLAYSVARSVGAKWQFSGSIQVNPGSWPFGFQMGLAGNLDIEAQEGYEQKAAYGYMNSDASNTNTSDQKLWDFHLEKPSTFEPRDKYLGIPFNNADVFSASGGDVIGAFRFSHSTVGAFHPNYFETEKKLRNLSIEIGIGGTFQIGIDFGVGKQITKVEGSWPMYFGSQTALFSSSVTPRFVNDPGGEVNYDDDDDQIQYASIFLDKTLDLSQIDNQRDNTKYKSTTDIAYTKTADKITAIKITNKDGSVSNYGDAVMTGEEVELTVGVSSNQDGKYLVTQPLEYTYPLKNSSAIGQRRDETYANTFLLTEKYSQNYIDATGNGPTPDDFGGWTKFHYQTKYGGTGTSPQSQWYRFRSPYAGLTYNSGRLIDNTDQSGSMSSGFKEVKYLKLIETKSHIAFFVTDNLTNANFQNYFPIGTYGYLYSGGSPLPSILTYVKGSGNTRRDGLEAKGIVNNKDAAAEDLAAKGTKTQEKLEKIVLFAKSDLTTPLTTTFFEYDYSLCPGIPNTSEPTSSPSKERGKLTLKKVWTESNGITRTQIAPYQFFYEYFNQYPTDIATTFKWAQDYNAIPSNDPNQNPWYEPEALDPWGFYQEDGVKRFKKSQTWVSQKDLSGNTSFDPAAWQLKRIKLPSGGEIHVHYEQKDYAAVQDLLPMSMVSLKDGSGNQNGYKSDDSEYMINLTDIGVASADAADYKNLLEDYFLANRNKLYFKVLYTYDGDEKPELNTGTNKYEYSTGYTVVNDVTLSGSDIILSLGERRNLLAGGKRDKTLPRYVCYQNVMSNGYHTLGKSAGGFKSDDYTNKAYANNPVNADDLKDAARNAVIQNSLDMFWDWLGGKIKNVKRKEACKTLNFENSYFKLPVFHAKKGGGIRVKRLLTYDAGISGDSKSETVYGSEFIYEAQNGSSSGVAVNEPAPIREESALTIFMERKRQRWFEQFRKQMPTSAYEGIPGESVLPGAEVGHSRVVIKNIRDNISTGGYVVKNYHTCKEYPFKYDYTNLTKKDKTYRNFDLSYKWNQRGKPFQLRTSRAWVAQGYLFTLNDMHGKIKDETTYPGLYSPTSFYSQMANDGNTYNRSVPVKPIGKVFYETMTNAFHASEPAFTNKTTYKYSEPGEEIPLITYDAATKKFTKEMAKPGKEQDLTIYESTVKENMTDFSIELDINIQIPLAVTLGFWGAFKISQDLICQHVTSKVVSHKTHLLSTTTSNSGVWQTTENLAFDKYTADPVFTRTYDGYGSQQNKLYTMAGGTTPHSGFIYALSIPAAWIYPDMAPKSYGVNNLNTLGSNAGSIVTYSDNPLYDHLVNSTSTVFPISSSPFDNVLSATATTFKKGWFTTAGTGLSGTALTQANAQYFPEETFNYRDEVTQAGITGGKIYNGGTVIGPIAFFDWLNPTTNSQAWYSPSKATKYSPHGYAVEEQDLLKIKSSAKYGYEDMLPVTVAQNAGYDDVKFLDFEYTVNGFQSMGTTVVAHTGRCSFDLSASQNHVFVSSYPVTTDILARGLSVRFWLRSRLSNVSNNINYGLKNQNPMLKVKLGNQLFDCATIAQTGEWTLYAADITNFQGLNGGNHNISLVYNMSSTETVYVDDFRVQPLDASSKCSVYYPDHRLAAQFDDQHFATLYEYNNKGQLVRKSIETERGLKTLQEQQYNTPLINN